MAGRPCTVCTSRDRKQIELAAARGATPSAVSKQFGTVSTQAVRRHMADHAPKSMERAIVAAGGRDLAAGLGLAEEAHDLYDRTITILGQAENAKQLPIALMAIREARGNLELLGKFTGKLRPDTQVNVLVTSPDWIAARSRIVAALAAHPEARRDVLEAIGG